MNEFHDRREWFALQVRANYELATAAKLKQRGEEVLVPTRIIQRRWSDRLKRLEVPLFTGYLFCRSDLKTSSRIVTVPGVVRIVGNGYRPVAIPDVEIKSIALSVRSQLKIEPCAIPEVGRRVKVLSGPLCGAIGVVTHSRSDVRFIVTIALLQSGIAVKLDRNSSDLLELD